MRSHFSNRFWIMLIGCVLIVFAITALALGRMPAENARVYLNGEPVRTIALSGSEGSLSFVVESDAGMNLIAVEHGRICVADSSCPDGTCVRQGWKSGGAAPIVCLPNGLVITFDNRVKSDVDAIVG